MSPVILISLRGSSPIGNLSSRDFFLWTLLIDHELRSLGEGIVWVTL
jgi:hypothetical protein